jgi:hypothetical protein
MCSRIPVSKAMVNPDDKIGTIQHVPGGCSYAGSVVSKLGSYIPDNKEYEWAGEGSQCYFCSLDYPDSISCAFGCDGPRCCAVVGRTGTYKRISYKADPAECCKTGNLMIENLTCDPKYRDSRSESCYSYVKDYCINGDSKLFTDDVCKSWCGNNEVECSLYKKRFCNTKGINDKLCRDWCLRNPGLCDDSAVSFCETTKGNENDPFCYCLNSRVTKYKLNPLCVDRKCIDHGYATSSMIDSRGKGCEIVDCSTYFDIKSEGKTELDDVVVNQACGEAPSSTIVAPPKKTNWWLWLIIAIIVLIFIAIFIFVDIKK